MARLFRMLDASGDGEWIDTPRYRNRENPEKGVRRISDFVALVLIAVMVYAFANADLQSKQKPSQHNDIHNSSSNEVQQ